MFQGVYTALITPFRDGKLDRAGLKRMVERQVAAGIHGLVPCGTTGEGTTLTDTERLEVVEATIEAAAGRCVIIAGVGTNDTAQTVRLTQAAQKLGADGALVITPYYNKPTQEGLYHHSRTVAEQGGLPVMLYNVPSRTGVSFSVDTVARLADVPGIVALKEATADMVYGAEVLAVTEGRLDILSGDDTTAFPLWALGGHGVVSVASNLVPERMVDLWRLHAAGDQVGARKAHMALLPLFKALFFETNPGPLKRLMAWTDLELSPELRLPLVVPTPETTARLRAVAVAQGLLAS